MSISFRPSDEVTIGATTNNGDDGLIDLSGLGSGAGRVQFSDFITATPADITYTWGYSKDHIIECIKTGLTQGTITYKDIILAIKEVKDEQ